MSTDGISGQSGKIETADRKPNAQKDIPVYYDGRDRMVPVNEFRRARRELKKEPGRQVYVRVRYAFQKGRGPAELVRLSTVLSGLSQDRGCRVSLDDLLKECNSPSKSEPGQPTMSAPADYVRCLVNGVVFFAKRTTLCIPIFRVFGHFEGGEKDGSIIVNTVVFKTLKDCHAAGISMLCEGKIMVSAEEVAEPPDPVIASRPFEPETNVWPD